MIKTRLLRCSRRALEQTKTERSDMQIKTNKNAGFTLVEIMIVVAIIGLLAAIAIPNFVKARESAQLNSIINNLRIIEGAKDQWALENKKGTGDLPTWAVSPAGILEYLKGGTVQSEAAWLALVDKRAATSRRSPNARAPCTTVSATLG